MHYDIEAMKNASSDYNLVTITAARWQNKPQLKTETGADWEEF